MGTLSGTVKDSDGDPAARTVRAYRRDNGALLGQASSAELEEVEGDPYFSNVSLLIAGNGANDSTDIFDISPSPKTLTLVGNTKISTAQSAFAGSSIAFDGSGDYIDAGQSSEYVFGTGNFSVRCSVRLADTSTDQSFIYYVNPALTSGSDVGWGLAFYGAGLGGVTRFFFYNGTDQYYVEYSTALTVNTWYDMEAVRSGTDLLLFVNGTLVHTVGSVSAAVNVLPSATLRVGYLAPTATRYVNGHMQAIRVDKGTARHTANFTPPAAPLPGVGSAANDLGDFQIDTGAFTGECTVIALDADGGDANALVFDRVTPA